MKATLTAGLLSVSLITNALACPVCAQTPQHRVLPEAEALQAKSVSVTYLEKYDLLAFEIQVEADAGTVVPVARGQLDEAPVLGYVVPTTLKPEDVGFNPTEGIVALAITSHPDFDDTPLWDENADADYANDGVIWHPHWVVLNPDDRIGALAVKQFEKGDPDVILPPTNPGMPMYMDSPGYPIVTDGKAIRVTVPAYRIRNQTQFNYDGVVAYMEVNTSDKKRPMLGVYKVYSVVSGDLSLPYKVSSE